MVRGLAPSSPPFRSTRSSKQLTLTRVPLIELVQKKRKSVHTRAKSSEKHICRYSHGKQRREQADFAWKERQLGWPKNVPDIRQELQCLRDCAQCHGLDVRQSRNSRQADGAVMNLYLGGHQAFVATGSLQVAAPPSVQQGWRAPRMPRALRCSSSFSSSHHPAGVGCTVNGFGWQSLLDRTMTAHDDRTRYLDQCRSICQNKCQIS